ncbi:unnamed protein product [Closterium sp. NIES-53]
MAASARRAVTQGLPRRGGAFSTAAGLLPVLLLALLLQAPSASARRWFWNDALFPVAPAGETNPTAAFTAAESGGSATAAESAPAVATPAAAAAPAGAPAVASCYDAPLDPFIASGAAPDPCAALAAELKRTGVEKLGAGFAAPSLFRACHSTFLFRKDCHVEDLLSIANGFDNHYVYKHIAMDSPDQTNLPSSIDIVAELRKIVTNGEKGKYTQLVDAHMAVRRATLALNDGHSMFYPVCFFGKFKLPLPLVAVVENGQQIIRVAPRRYVRGNSGGSVQAAYTAVRLLMGAAKVPDSDFTLPLDFVIGTPYTEKAMGLLSVDNTTAPHYYQGLYTDLNGTELSSVFDYAPFRELRFTEAGRAGNYSAPFKFDYKKQLPVTQKEPIFGDRPFMVLSDGNCFSACAVLTHMLGKRHKVPMVTVGGLPNQPPDVSSSCLGFTLTDYYAMAEGLYKLAATDPQKGSMPLKVQGVLTMAFTNAYVDSNIPCEFEFLPSQHHINYTVDLIDKPWAMWSEVAKLFASAAA